MNIEFTNHNIRLDDGNFTKPEMGYSMESYPWFLSSKRILNTVFPGDKSNLRIADLGCLEGGYAVEFARMGFQTVGIEVRETNIAACRYVKAHTNLPNLEFIKDDAWNVANYGNFDAIFCSGLLYHLDRPKQFLEILAAIANKLVILQTHFATQTNGANTPTQADSNIVQKLSQQLFAKRTNPSVLDAQPQKFNLSQLCENESLMGRWYAEFKDDQEFNHRETAKWSSWDNYNSFWIQREYLLQSLQDVGFDLVLEQYDSLGENIAESMLNGYYKTDSRGTFIGIKTNS